MCVWRFSIVFFPLFPAYFLGQQLDVELDFQSVHLAECRRHSAGLTAFTQRHAACCNSSDPCSRRGVFVSSLSLSLSDFPSRIRESSVLFCRPQWIRGMMPKMQPSRPNSHRKLCFAGAARQTGIPHVALYFFMAGEQPQWSQYD